MNKPLPSDRNHTLRNSWEARASHEGCTKSSVLFRGLSENINQYIHDFHEYILLKYYLPCIESGASVLDLGCGYGRITRIITEHTNGVHITGLDFSVHYCSLFNKQTDHCAVCADLTQNPFPEQSFDSIIAVTSLMYIPIENREKIMKSISVLLKPGGTAFFLDPGQEFIKLVNIINPSRQKLSTGGRSFTAAEYDRMITNAGFEIVRSGGMTFFSLTTPLLLLTNRFLTLQKFILKLTSMVDKLCDSSRFLSLHHWLLVKK